MKFFSKEEQGSLVLSCLAATLLTVQAGRAQDSAVPVERLRLPIEHYEDGTVKTQLKAEHALVPQAGAIVASNVVVELFRPDASTDAVIHAEDCRYDREEGKVESDSKIRVERNGIVITGRGFEWYGDKERVKILSMARVVFQRDLSRTQEFLTERKERAPE